MQVHHPGRIGPAGRHEPFGANPICIHCTRINLRNRWTRFDIAISIHQAPQSGDRITCRLLRLGAGFCQMGEGPSNVRPPARRRGVVFVHVDFPFSDQPATGRRPNKGLSGRARSDSFARPVHGPGKSIALSQAAAMPARQASRVRLKGLLRRDVLGSLETSWHSEAFPNCPTVALAWN